MMQYLVLLGAAANIFGGFYYIKDTLAGTTKPNRVTWLMWSIAPLIGTVAALAAQVTWAVLPVFMAGFVPLLVFAASFKNKNAYWQLRKLDYLCGLFSLLALILWAITKEPVVAIALALASDGFAVVPTFIKSWTDPDTESSIAYSTGVFSALTGFAAVNNWNFSEYGWPIYLVIANASLLISIYHKKIASWFS